MIIIHERIIQEAKRLFIHTMKEVKPLLTNLVLKMKPTLVGFLKSQQVSVRENHKKNVHQNL
jgi:hypothetical protein